MEPIVRKKFFTSERTLGGGCLWIGAEDLAEGAVLFQFGQRFLQGRLAGVPVDIDKEKIFPGFPLRRPAFDLAHADAQSVERLQRGKESAGLVLHAEHERRS